MLPVEICKQIAMDSERNVRKAILQLQSTRVLLIYCKMKSNSSSEKLKPYVPEWRRAISKIVNDILTEQSPQSLRAIRETVYDLLVNCIPPELIIKYVLVDLLGSVDQEVKFQLIHWAAHHENRVEFYNLDAVWTKTHFPHRSLSGQTHVYL